ncbi:uracil-DNA glycosylase, family 4 [Sinosporangium album]|uniref:Type-5 uracil-DNA glycosylase n=1 Tax=Sinosporangium album TaxID=504805 RepID=A0A1G8AKB4_9ACTN|nr:uracil-DNA glycosylase [Sinosporangium album]SDH21283.1 uracil-DNA glycosylase, family 4 [Sinosporangium album]
MSYVSPGSGWPGDPASPDTPVAHDAAQVAELAGGSRTLAELTARQSVCRACPRLVEWREQVADVKRRAFADEEYWGRPVPGWGAEKPRILLMGLAPAAHGGNRTGRIFTGDRSGDWLFASLHRVGLAAQETSVRADDGQRLIGARVAAAVRCAPPGNKPLPQERAACAPWLVREVSLVVPDLRVVVALGSFAWQSAWTTLREVGVRLPPRRVPFGHGVEVAADGLTLIGCYHPSQQNTFTGRVTAPMLDVVFSRAAELAESAV